MRLPVLDTDSEHDTFGLALLKSMTVIPFPLSQPTVTLLQGLRRSAAGPKRFVTPALIVLLCVFFASPSWAQSSDSYEMGLIMTLVKNEIQRTGGMAKFLFYLVAYFLSMLVAIWISSRIVAGANGTFLKGVAYWFATLIVGLIMLLMLLVGISLGVALDSPGFAMAVLTLTLLAALITTVVIPMKMYDIGFFRSVGFLILLLVLGAAANLGLDAVYWRGDAPFSELADMSDAERKEFTRN
jgi:hypothetical protein